MTENWRCDHGKAVDDYCAECEARESVKVVVGVCREDNPRDVDEAYGAGTYERLFPSEEPFYNAETGQVEDEQAYKEWLVGRRKGGKQ